MKKNNNNNEEKVTDVKETIVGFIAPDPVEKTQEEEIQNFKLKKESERELARLSEEEQKAKREKYKEEEEKLEGVKAELIRSIKERIPKIEEKFKLVIANAKKGKIVEKIQGKTQEKIKEKEENFEQSQNLDEKER